MTVLVEGAHAAQAILSEGDLGISRDNLMIAASQTILPCGLLALQVADAGATVTVVEGGNTGDGVLTIADPATNTKVKQGRYVLTITEAVSDGGKFVVEDPNGQNIGEGAVGVLFNKEIKFTLADGATDFALNDQFFIDVDTDPVTGEHYVAYDPTATDGSEVPVAMSIYLVTTGVGETFKAAGITRFAQLNKNCIAWPDGITTAQKSAAADALAKSMIILR